MKVYLGKYVYPITTYDIASKIIFWENDEYRKKLNSILKFGLTHNQNSKNKKLSILSKFLDKYNSYQKRKVFIKIDDYDVYDLDYTLSLIIEPALKKLVEDEWLSFKVDNEDLPKELQISDDEYKLISFTHSESDPRLHEIYNRLEQHRKYVINKMIYAFNILSSTETDEDDEYYKKEIDEGLRLFGKYFRNLWI